MVCFVRQILAWLLAVLLLTFAPCAMAASPRVVLLSDAHEPDPAVGELNAQLVAAASAQLAEINVAVELRPEAQSSLPGTARHAREVATSWAALAVIWCKRDADGLQIFFYDPGNSRLYARRVSWSGSPSASSEELAIVVRSAVSAVLEGSAISMSEVPLPEPLPAPPAAPTPPVVRATETRKPAAPPADIVRLGVSYVGTLYATHAAWQNGAALSLSVRPERSRWFAGLAYTYFAALPLNERGIRTEVRRHPGELFVGSELHLAPFGFVAEGAFEADYVERSTEQVPDGFSAAAASQRWLWAVSTRLGGAFPLADRVRCFLDVGAEFLLNRFDYAVSGAAGRETVASPMIVRPRLEAGLSVALW